jgi:type I site-specific restriction endonuclease
MPTEADTCRTYIVPKLHAAGWEDDLIAEQRVIAPGRIVPTGQGHIRQNKRRPDYILFLRKDYPIAVVEAKAEYHQPGDGLQQAMNYVQMIPLPLYAQNKVASWPTSTRCCPRCWIRRSRESCRPEGPHQFSDPARFEILRVRPDSATPRVFL